jgi:hypothetical protein
MEGVLRRRALVKANREQSALVHLTPCGCERLRSREPSADLMGSFPTGIAPACLLFAADGELRCPQARATSTRNNQTSGTCQAKAGHYGTKLIPQAKGGDERTASTVRPEPERHAVDTTMDTISIV